VDIEATLRNVIVEQLGYTGSPDDLTTDYELLDSDVIDSLGILSLVSFIEDHWSIEIDDDQLVPDTFATLGAMTALVEGHLS
jgi:acyl carrier protein